MPTLFLLLGLALQAPAQATPARLPPSPADTANYRLVPVARGIYAFIAPDGITPMVSGNSTVVIGDSAVLVVDSGQFPSVTRWEIGKIEALTKLPVRYLVNTHWHPDHWLGNGEFKARYPEVVIISTPRTQSLMGTNAQPLIDPKRASGTLNALKSMLAAGNPMPDDTRLWYQYALGELEVLAPELEGASVAYPIEMVTEQATFDLGHRKVQVKFLGRGNTGGDLIAWIPDTRTLVAGDLVVHPYPYGFGSFIGEWIETMGKLAAFKASAIVPGHGEVERDNAYIKEVTALLESLQQQAREASDKGLTLEAAAKAVDLTAFRKRMCADGSPYCRRGFDESVAAAFARAFREAKEGRLADEK